jgi:hypothetical protein
LMLNAVSVNTIDYKSIALPAELQGHLFSCLIFIPKGQLNQCIKSLMGSQSVDCSQSKVTRCRSFVPNLSVYLSVWGSAFTWDFISSFNFIKTIKTWSGIYENIKVNKVYQSLTRENKTYR